MKKTNLFSTALLCGTLCLGTNVATAAVVAGVSFDSNAFADTIISSTGTWSTSGPSLTTVLTDDTPSTWAFSGGTAGYVELGFTDNAVVNGTGVDLAIFEIGTADSFNVTINGTQNTYLGTDTGFDAGPYNINLAEINLDDFGVASGAAISSLILFGEDVVGGVGCCRPTYGLVGALNNLAAVPEPATLGLLGLGLLGLGISRKAKRS